MHWADNFAKQIIERKEKKEYIIESGITPSGVVHIGNFREIATQYYIYNSVLKLGKKAKFLFIWDDFDRFRKVPKGVPNEFEKYIGMPIYKVLDPWGCHDSYAEHFESKLAEETKELDIKLDFLNAATLYQKCIFSENIKISLENTRKIKNILNKFRKEPLAENWLPVNLYCENCYKDSTDINYPGGYELQYKCNCGYENKIDFRKTGIVKLKWRIDWPSRWKYFNVDFESSGKEHKASGGSWDTAIILSKEIFNYEPPIGPMYEFIYLKGQKEKMSSSKGNVKTISDLLKVYEPEVIRFVYTQRLNKAIFLPFDTDIFGIYDNFDLCEKMYYKIIEGKDDLIRKYELSKTEEYKKCPTRIRFSELSLIVQVTKKEKLAEHIYNLMFRRGYNLEEWETDLNLNRAKKAKNWIELYAPDEVKIKLCGDYKLKLDKEQKDALMKLSDILKRNISTEDLQKEIFNIAKESIGKELFRLSYMLLIGKQSGPKLADLIDIIGRDKVINRLNIL